MAPAAPSGRGSLLETPSLVKLLTAREREVLALLREPLSKEIARRLNVSTVTVKRHTANIYGKLGVNSRWDAVAKACGTTTGLNYLTERQDGYLCRACHVLRAYPRTT